MLEDTVTPPVAPGGPPDRYAIIRAQGHPERYRTLLPEKLGGYKGGSLLNPPSRITIRMLSVPFYRRLRGITDILLAVDDAIRFTGAFTHL